METEDEMIQRLIKEGLAKTETDEEKIKRLVKEEITRGGEINKKWEIKKRQALDAVTWQDVILPNLIIAFVAAYLFGWVIASIAYFIIIVALYYYIRNQTLKQWESPESYERITHKKFE